MEFRCDGAPFLLPLLDAEKQASRSLGTSCAPKACFNFSLVGSTPFYWVTFQWSCLVPTELQHAGARALSQEMTRTQGHIGNWFLCPFPLSQRPFFCGFTLRDCQCRTGAPAQWLLIWWSRFGLFSAIRDSNLESNGRNNPVLLPDTIIIDFTVGQRLFPFAPTATSSPGSLSSPRRDERVCSTKDLFYQS